MSIAQQKAIAKIYRDAAIERISASTQLYEKARYVEANYLAGLAVECMLRAYRTMIEMEFDARHDIERLHRLARFADVVPPNDLGRIMAALGEVITLWSNDHRFLSEPALRARWSKRKLYQGVKGNFVKERTRQLVNAANQIVNVGVSRWKQ